MDIYNISGLTIFRFFLDMSNLNYKHSYFMNSYIHYPFQVPINIWKNLDITLNVLDNDVPTIGIFL